MKVRYPLATFWALLGFFTEDVALQLACCLICYFYLWKDCKP